LIEEILLLLRASEKEKVPTIPASPPYERTLIAVFMTALKEIVELDIAGFITQDFLHTKLREIEVATVKFSDTKNRAILLSELSELIEQTRPRPTPPRTKTSQPASSKKPFDPDDDIPF
jgi:hypothetical protein